MTQEQVKELLEYRDGKLYWINKRAPGIKAGTEAGCINKLIPSGPRHKVKINAKLYSRSRLVFLYFNGYMPECVDHIDRDTLNDKIENLRAATKSQNGANRTPCGKTSKYLGVRKEKGHWIAAAKVNHKRTYLDKFDTEKEAALAYNAKAIEFHGEFANLNIID